MHFPNYRQLDSRDCGPVCLQIICKYYGKYIEMEHIRQLMNTGREGSSVYDFINAASQLEIKCLPYSLSYWKFRHEVTLPCVIMWQNRHFIVVYKITAKHVFVSDPAIGLCKYTLKEFACGWLNSIPNSNTKRGICITCEPTIQFKQVIGEKKTSNYLEALNFFWSYMRPYRKQMTQIIMVLLSVTLISALFPVITQSIIDTGIPNTDYNFITLMLIATIALSIGRLLGQWLQQSIGLRFSAKIKVEMVSDYLSRLFKMPMQFFETRIMGDLIQRNADFDRIEANTLNSVFSVILGILNLLVFGTILFIYNKTIFWVYSLGALLYILWILVFWAIRKKMDIRYYSLMAKDQSMWIEFLTCVSDIKSYRYANREKWKWEKNQVNLYDTRIKLLNVEQMQNIGSGLINSIKDAVLTYLSAVAVINGEMTLGMLTSVQYILGQLSSPLSSIVNFIISLQLSMISYGRVSDIQKLQSENDITDNNDMLTDFSSGLKLENVHYRYNGDVYALKNLSIRIPYGKVVAIVGESGCGKSTLLKLLSNIYSPTSGTIYCGEMKLSSISASAWRERCGIITQESALLRDSIYNNIVFGRPSDSNKILRAVSVANIKEEIERLPNGYDTMIGENGRGVSEGQKQRILLARAIYDDPDYVFLDEMTSSLDVRNEQNVIKSLKNAMPSKSIVIVSHRPETISNADFIIVLKNGFITECGSHDKLLAQGGEYYRLFSKNI